MHNGEYFERHGGYLAAASWLARGIDNETLIFRKFDTLSAANLLYMQSEILELEKRLEHIQLNTAQSDDMDLKDAANEMLLLQSQIAQLKHPENRPLAAARHFFEKPYHILGGKAKSFLKDSSDLVTLRNPNDMDYLSRFLQRHWVTEASSITPFAL
ncbi:hypothetical protein CGCFRS4_v008555 [Colletotrichum fructicola]|nr:hypothetical protein CGCFRS4_v008555 [Colletotrichum fructicola]